MNIITVMFTSLISTLIVSYILVVLTPIDIFDSILNFIVFSLTLYIISFISIFTLFYK